MIAYLDCPSGISGDMFLGCLVDAGWTPQQLRRTIDRLRLPEGEWAVRVQPVQKGPLRATQVDVLFEEGPSRRRLSDVREIIESSDLPDTVKARSISVFKRLADAEAKVHGTTPDEVHFHEVGAIDAIVDVVGAVNGLHELEVEQLYASALPLGSGWTQTDHGKIPLPAPATLELLSSAHAPTRPALGPGEWVTPTGAALLAELAIFEQPTLALSRIGTGAGQRDCAWPNVARLWLGEAQSRGALVQLETNIDDMNPQLYSAVSQKLFDAGAKDVWFTPIQMKKGRPATLVGVLCAGTDEMRLADMLLRETTTLGVRVHGLRARHEARREMRDVETRFGTVKVKVKWVGHEPCGATPEFDDCLKLAQSKSVPVREVYDSAVASAHELLQTMKRLVENPDGPGAISSASAD
ncbi:MAG TPA: nickel pincer cofactor biosynthesis protein LarC [Tepidisphaeraceae bacterium]|nr:nickel pincer cofactor biosynthesis protein LarC [Tepidisphaeraceae bacterium]